MEVNNHCKHSSNKNIGLKNVCTMCNISVFTMQDGKPAGPPDRQTTDYIHPSVTLMQAMDKKTCDKYIVAELFAK